MPDLLACLTFAILCAPIFAHDTWLLAWIENGVLEGTGTSSDSFPRPESPIKPERVESAHWVTSSESMPAQTIVPGEFETRFAWPAPENQPGIAALQLTPHPIVLEREAFSHYLDSEGVLEKYATRIQDVNFEHYTKCAKAVPKGTSLEEVAALRGNHHLEIIWAQDGFQVLFEGDPLPECRIDQRTDANSGWTYVRAHLIQPVETGQAKWESFWATLTYAV